MYKYIVLFCVACLFTSCQNEKIYSLTTDQGEMKFKLLDAAPKHKENFEKLVKDGFYSDLLFHRIIKGFMIQGGDPESRMATEGQPLGSGSPGYTIPAEIGVPHFKGMLSAARIGGPSNPAKESNGSQFFIVQGAAVTDAELDSIEKTKGFRYSTTQREKYKKVGGSPMLDGDYSVFGEVIEGLEVLDKISSVAIDSRDRPLKDVKMTIK